MSLRASCQVTFQARSGKKTWGESWLKGSRPSSVPGTQTLGGGNELLQVVLLPSRETTRALTPKGKARRLKEIAAQVDLRTNHKTTNGQGMKMMGVLNVCGPRSRTDKPGWDPSEVEGWFTGFGSL